MVWPFYGDDDVDDGGNEGDCDDDEDYDGDRNDNGGEW